MAVLNQVALVPKVSTLQLGFVPGRVQQRAKLLLRAIGGVCAQRGAKVEVGKRGEPRPEKGDAEVKVPDDPKLRLELKVKIDAVECNARKAKGGEGVGRLRGHTIGVDFGDAKTGLSVSRGGYAPRPLTVVRQKGDRLLETILQVALQEKADEFVVGLPKGWDGKDTEQAHKCRSFAGRLSYIAARRGWRVYLHDEYGTSQDALGYMIDIGSNRRSRKEQVDAYAAMALLCNYFDSSGSRAKIVVPKSLDLQQLLCQGPAMPLLSRLEDDDEFGDFDDE